MTAFAFILGVVPLMLASGAGAGAQNVMGTAVFWGMLVATALGVFLIPGNFAFVQGLRFSPAETAAPAPAAAAPHAASAGASVKRSALVAAGGAPARRLHRGPRLPAARRCDAPPDFRGALTPATAESLGDLAMVAALPGRDPAVADPDGARRELRRAHRRRPHPRGARAGDDHPLVPVPRAERPPAAPRTRASRAELAVAVQLREPFAPAGGLDLSFEIDLWGRFRRATEAARADLLASEDARAFVITTLVSDVGSAYFLLRALDQELEIARRTLACARDRSGSSGAARQAGWRP